MIKGFFEALYYHPKWYHWIVAILLLPISIVYGIVMYIRRIISSPTKYSIPIISIGNLLIGGSGKTPFAIALATKYADKNVTMISRGYGRQSSGLVEVSWDGDVLTDVQTSGDEAMLMATSLPSTSVIVSEDRDKAIDLAIQQGSGLILLDDGFSRVEIDKYEILLEPNKIPNSLPLPSGPFREFAFSKSKSDLHLQEDIDFTRAVSYENLTKRMVLVTAIANPSRLDEYLPKGVVHKEYLDDHAYFSQENLEQLLIDYNATSLLVTQKDLVKMEGFKLPVSLIKLKLEIKKGILQSIQSYIGGFDAR